MPRVRLRSPRVIAANLLPVAVVQRGIHPRHVIAGMELPRAGDRKGAGARVVCFEGVGTSACRQKGNAAKQQK